MFLCLTRLPEHLYSALTDSVDASNLLNHEAPWYRKRLLLSLCSNHTYPLLHHEKCFVQRSSGQCDLHVIYHLLLLISITASASSVSKAVTRPTSVSLQGSHCFVPPLVQDILWSAWGLLTSPLPLPEVKVLDPMHPQQQLNGSPPCGKHRPCPVVVQKKKRRLHNLFRQRIRRCPRHQWLNERLGCHVHKGRLLQDALQSLPPFPQNRASETLREHISAPSASPTPLNMRATQVQ